MYQITNEKIPETTQKKYTFKNELIKLVSINDGLLEPTQEAIEFLTNIKDDKLCILSFNGPSSTGKTELMKNIIKNLGGTLPNDTKTTGLWIWGFPLPLNNGGKLLLIDSQGLDRNDQEQIAHKLFILNVLISTCVVYNTKGELSDKEISDLIYYTDISNKVNLYPNKNDKKNNIDNLREYFPEIIVVKDTMEAEKIQNIIENNTLSEKFCKLFKKKNYINNKNNELKDYVKKNINYKVIDNTLIDGDSLFGLIQNYLDAINDGDNPTIHSAIENVLLSQAAKISNKIKEKFKINFQKKIKYPMSITNIYNIFLELEQESFAEFCKSVQKICNSTQTGEYIKEMHSDLEKELEMVLDSNKEHYDEWFNIEYKNIDQELSKIKLESIGQVKLFTLLYTTAFQNCLNKFLAIPNNDFCKDLINILSKIFKDFISNKLISIGEQMNSFYENYTKESDTETNNLKETINKLNEQINNNKALLDNKNKEKSEANKNYLELESKLEKLTRELKSKEKEYETNLNIEKENSKKLELYNNAQLKEKEQQILALSSKNESLSQEILNANKDSLLKINELNRENIKLKSEIERLKKQDGKSKSDIYNQQSINLQTLFKSIQSTFMEFKGSVDKLDKENENLLKIKYLENSTKDMEEKLQNSVNDMKSFCDNQVKEMNKHYEEEIKKMKEEQEKLKLNLLQKNTELKEINEKKNLFENIIEENKKQISELNELSNSKDGIINSQNEAMKNYEDLIKENKNTKNTLEITLAKSIYDLKMKEDEFEYLFIVIESILSKKKDKYENNLKKLSPETQDAIKALVKSFKVFK